MTKNLLCLTICQPHAWAVVLGPKRYENRRWPSRHLGPLLIHAGKSREYLEDFEQYPGEPPAKELTFGAIVGVVNQVGCWTPEQVARKHGRTWNCVEGPHCHEYADRRAFVDPIPCKGALGYWRPDDALWGRIEAEIARAIPVGVAS